MRVMGYVPSINDEQEQQQKKGFESQFCFKRSIYLSRERNDNNTLLNWQQKILLFSLSCCCCCCCCCCLRIFSLSKNNAALFPHGQTWPPNPPPCLHLSHLLVEPWNLSFATRQQQDSTSPYVTYVVTLNKLFHGHISICFRNNEWVTLWTISQSSIFALFFGNTENCFSRKKSRAFSEHHLPSDTIVKELGLMHYHCSKTGLSLYLSLSHSLVKHRQFVCLSVRVCLTSESRTWTDKWTEERTSFAHRTRTYAPAPHNTHAHTHTHSHTLSFFLLPPFYLPLSLSLFLREEKKPKFCWHFASTSLPTLWK